MTKGFRENIKAAGTVAAVLILAFSAEWWAGLIIGGIA